VTTSSC